MLGQFDLYKYINETPTFSYVPPASYYDFARCLRNDTQANGGKISPHYIWIKQCCDAYQLTSHFFQQTDETVIHNFKDFKSSYFMYQEEARAVSDDFRIMCNLPSRNPDSKGYFLAMKMNPDWDLGFKHTLERNYRVLSIQYHSEDVTLESITRIYKLDEAYAVLSNEKLRAEYAKIKRSLNTLDL